MSSQREATSGRRSPTPTRGGEPPAPTWEPEALACWRAANPAGWGSVELRRNRHDGRWPFAGFYHGAPVSIVDGLYGIGASAEDAQRRHVFLEKPVDPAQGPAQLARCVDQGMALED